MFPVAGLGPAGPHVLVRSIDQRRRPLALAAKAYRVEDRCADAVLVLVRMHRLGLLQVAVARAQRPMRRRVDR